MITLKIEGMSCGHCVGSVRKALTAVPGVKEVKEISLEHGTATVEGTPDPQQLVTAVEEEGYKAQLA